MNRPVSLTPLSRLLPRAAGLLSVEEALAATVGEGERLLGVLAEREGWLSGAWVDAHLLVG
jgi:hypothetical protein